MNNYQQTIEAFDKQAAAYQNIFMDMHLYDDTYDTFCNLVKPNARVLELGCGPGNITKYVLSKRPDLQLEATDAAPAMVALAQENNPTASCRVLDVRDLQNVSGTYDGLICGFCMPYLTREDCETLFQNSAKLLNRGGIIYASTIEGNYSQSRVEKSSNGQYQSWVYFHQEDYLRQFLENAALEVVHVFRKAYAKANGTTDSHLIFIARKN